MTDIVKKVWHMEVKKKEHSSMREKAVKALTVFFVLMFIFTILSRAANAMTIPRVSTESPQKRSINHTVQADGTIESQDEQPILTVDGLKIGSVPAEKGKQVKAGELLLQIDIDDLNEKIKELELEAESIGLEISDAQYNRSLQTANREKNINRAVDNYNAAVDSGNRSVDQAYQEMLNAQKTLEDYYNTPLSESDSSSDSSDNDSNSGSSDNSDQEEQLRADFEAKKSAYEDAIVARDETIREKNNAIEDAQTESEKSSTVENADIKKETLEIKLAKYKELLKQEGKITAPADGVITAIDETVVTGGVTPVTKLMLLAKEDAGFKFVTTITKEEQKYVSLGDEITLATKDNKNINGLTVTSITKNEKEDDTYEVTASLNADGEVNLYDSATMKVSGTAKAYGTCISKNALRKDANGQDYVLLLAEKDTVLGKQLEAEALNVNVLDSNDTYAALTEGEIASVQKIVLSSDKEIQAGDTVRLAENDE